MKAIKKYNKGGNIKGANKVTGAKATRYTDKEKAMYEKGKRVGEFDRFPEDYYRVARKDKDLKKYVGTPGQPSAYYGGIRAAKTEAKDTSTLPMRKKVVRSLQTAGADKSLKKRK